MPEFHGTQVELQDLSTATAHACQSDDGSKCTWGVMGMQLTWCETHTSMRDDQGWLDHMVFARRAWRNRYPDAANRHVKFVKGEDLRPDDSGIGC